MAPDGPRLVHIACHHAARRGGGTPGQHKNLPGGGNRLNNPNFRNLLGDDAPTALFIEEHATLRDFERQLGDALCADDAADAVCEPAREIVSLLRAHIQREDEVLFPMARGLLGAEGLAVVSRDLKD